MIAESGEWRTESEKHILKNVLFAVLSIASLWSFDSRAQTLSDDSIFAAKIKQAKAARIDTLPIGERVAAMGKLFLGTPYVAHTLDSDATKEKLVVDLRGFDCVTFYENMLAFARIIKKYPNPTMEN
jgi:cell wall-associated NlpC family hydrolase